MLILRYILGWTDGWLEEGMDGSVEGWIGRQSYRLMEGRIDQWLEGWIDLLLKGSTDGWINGQTDGLTDGWIDQSMYG